MRGIPKLMALLPVIFLFLAISFNANAIIVDGDLSDWGVDLGLVYSHSDPRWNDPYFKLGHEKQNPTRIDPQSFASSMSGVTWVVGNDNADISGGELFDVEAIYSYSTADDIYFAVVTSVNPNGSRWADYGKKRFGPGDLMLTVSDGVEMDIYGIGARPFGLASKKYGGALDSRDKRQTASWDDVDGRWKDAMLSTSAALVVKNADWSQLDPDHVNAYFIASSDYYSDWDEVFVGYSDACWRRAWAVGDYYTRDPYGVEQPYGTWIYETRISKNLLGLGAGAESNLLRASFSPDCGNDYLALCEFHNVPEPTTLIFIGTGITFIGIIRVRRTARKGKSTGI